MAQRARRLRIGRVGAVLLLCASSALEALDPERPPNRYGHDAWLSRDGLPQDFVQAVTQTPDGYLWIGTLGGLVRFDGVRFSVFDPASTPGLKDARITALCPGREGLWIGTASGGVSRLERGIIQAFEPEGGAADRSLKYVRSLYEAADGSLWVGTSGGGIRRFRQGRRVVDEEPPSPGHTITAIHQDRRGDVWIGTTTDGVTRLRGTSVIRYTAVEHTLPHNFVHAIFEDHAGAVWIGTRGGLTRIVEGASTQLTRRNGFPAETARTIWEDRDHNLWVGTLGQGLLRWRDGSFEALSGGSLSDDNVISLFEDREGSLWVGTQQGLNRLKDVAFTSYSRRDGLSRDQVNSLVDGRDGSVWIGTDGGGLNQLRDGRVRVFTKRDGLGSDYIGPLFESRDGSLWVGGDGFVSCLRGGRITTYRTDRIAPTGQGNFVSLIGEDKGGRLVVSIGDQPLLRLESGRLVPYDPAATASHYRFSMLRDREGALWFGTVDGLARLQDGRDTLFTKRDGLPDDTVHSAYQDAEGTLWIATTAGLCRFRDGRFVSFAGRDTPASGLISQVLEDGAGHLWLNGSRGIVRIRKLDLDAFAERRAASIPSTVFGTGDGMLSADYNPSYIQAPACRTKDGKLWFATTKGVAVIDPLRVPVNRMPPPVVLERALADDQVVPLGEGARVGPGRKKFEFHYTALSFLAPEKVRFRVMLEGFDGDWTTSHDRRAAYYTNLPPGHYRFRVKAANADGVWNEDGAAFAFELEPRFHQTRWFSLLPLGALGLAAWSLHRLRLRRIEARFAAVMGERNRMARELHDSLAQSLAGIALQAGALRGAEPGLSPAGSGHLDAIGRLVQRSLDEARGSVWDLHPESLRQRDLVEALRSMVRELTADARLDARLEVRGTPRRLGRAAERNIFRIAQEAVTNALKHAAGGQVEMLLSFEPGRVELRVRDNGRGFDPEALARTHAAQGFGMTSMRERAEQLGGRLTVNSQPGAGTEVVVIAPTT